MLLMAMLMQCSCSHADVNCAATAADAATVASVATAPAAAWLHDTVEDTPVTFQDIEKEFGAGVAQLVLDLTDVSKASDGNRAVRKAIDRGHLAQAMPRAKTIKLADLIDNCRDICNNNPRFARVSLRWQPFWKFWAKEMQNSSHRQKKRFLTVQHH